MTDSEHEWEQRLRGVYGRVEPPPGLGERILARAAEARPSRAWVTWRRGLELCAAVVVACVLVAVPWLHRREAEQRQAQEARARLVYALQITTGELNWAESRIGEDLAPRGTLIGAGIGAGPRVAAPLDPLDARKHRGADKL